MTGAFDLMAEAKWEMEGVRRAAERYREVAQVTDPRALPSGQRMLREVVPRLTEEVIQLQRQGADAIASASGKAAPWSWPIQLLEADKLALIALVCGLDAVRDQDGRLSSVTTIALAISVAVRDELEYQRWMAEQTAANKEARATSNVEHVDVLAKFRKQYPAANRKVWGRWRRKLALAREGPWAKEVSVALGAALISALCRAAPDRFEVASRRDNGGVRSVAYLRLNQETIELFNDIETRAEVARPLRMPMIIPPVPWRYE